MNDGEIVNLAVEMRAAQNEFYRQGRTREALARAKELESRFDHEIKLRNSDRAQQGRLPSMY
jgi:hypothetical protein